MRHRSCLHCFVGEVVSKSWLMSVPKLQAIQEVFCWSRNPMEVRRLTARKEEIYRQLLGDRTPLIPSGVRHLIEVLGKHQVYSSTAHLFSLLPPLQHSWSTPCQCIQAAVCGYIEFVGAVPLAC